MITKYKANTLNFEQKCNEELLTTQAIFMQNYLNVLEVRAEIEGIEL